MTRERVYRAKAYNLMFTITATDSDEKKDHKDVVITDWNNNHIFIGPFPIEEMHSIVEWTTSDYHREKLDDYEWTSEDDMSYIKIRKHPDTYKVGHYLMEFEGGGENPGIEIELSLQEVRGLFGTLRT